MATVAQIACTRQRDRIPPPAEGSCRPTQVVLDPAQLEPDIPGVLPAFLTILGEAGLHEAIERRRRRRLERRNGRWLGSHDRREERRLRRAGKRRRPRRHLVERRPEGKDVCPRVRLLALDLLGRHVLERAEDRSLLRQTFLRRKRREPLSPDPSPAGRGEGLGQSKVEQLHARRRQHHIGGLQVAMHDAGPVCLVQCVGDLDPVAQRLLERQRPLRQPIGEASRPRGTPSPGTRSRPRDPRRRARRCADARAARSSSPRARTAGALPATPTCASAAPSPPPSAPAACPAPCRPPPSRPRREATGSRRGPRLAQRLQRVTKNGIPDLRYALRMSGGAGLRKVARLDGAGTAEGVDAAVEEPGIPVPS